MKTRERMLDAAGRLFTAQGVSGTGTAAILELAEAPRGSLYHHFPGGKSQIVVESLERTGAMIGEALDRILAGADDPPDAMRRFAELWGRGLEASGWRAGCPITTATLELAATDPDVRAVCRAAYRDWQDRLARFLVSHGWHGDDAQVDAESIVATMEGALALARAQQDLGPLQRAGERLAGMLARP